MNWRKAFTLIELLVVIAIFDFAGERKQEFS